MPVNPSPRGEQSPAEQTKYFNGLLALAQRAYATARHATAAKLWGEALEADPKLADNRQAQYRYNAACGATLAACGQGKDDPPPDEVTKARLRQQALDWLKAELAVWAKFVEMGPPQARAAIVQTLEHWREDTDLTGVREPEALRKLPDEERKAWEALWANVVDLIKKAQGDRP